MLCLRGDNQERAVLSVCVFEKLEPRWALKQHRQVCRCAQWMWLSRAERKSNHCWGLWKIIFWVMKVVKDENCKCHDLKSYRNSWFINQSKNRRAQFWCSFLKNCLKNNLRKHLTQYLGWNLWMRPNEWTDQAPFYGRIRYINAFLSVLKDITVTGLQNNPSLSVSAP